MANNCSKRKVSSEKEREREDVQKLLSYFGDEKLNNHTEVNDRTERYGTHEEKKDRSHLLSTGKTTVSRS